MKSILRGSLRFLRRGRSGPASLRGYVDVPAADESFGHALPVEFCGWALDGLGRVAGVDLVLDDGRRVPARLGLVRPDVREALMDPRICLDPGWSASVEIPEWMRDKVRVTVLAKSLHGSERVLSDQVYRLTSSELVGGVGVPDTIVGSVLTVRGRAAIKAHGPSKIEIEVDGRNAGRARIRLPSGDPETTRPSTLFLGFELALVLDDLAGPGRHTVDALVYDADGQSMRLGRRTVQMTPRASSPREMAEIAATRADTQRLAAIAGVRHRRAGTKGRLRLLVFTHQLDLGGGQLYLQELLRQLVPSLEACTLVCAADGVLRIELQEIGVDVILSGHAPPGEYVAYEEQVGQFATLVAGACCDVVLVNTLSDFPAVDAAVRVGVPVVWAIHESFEIDEWLEMRFGRGGAHPHVSERMKGSLGAASRLVFESRATSEMFARYATPEQRLVVPYGVDVEGIIDYLAGFDRGAARARNGLDAEGTVLLCVGSVEERKAQACLAEAFGNVASARPDATLVLVGDRPGPYSTALHRLIDSLGLGHRLRLLPTSADIYEWYALCDVLVSASDVESLPRSMLEAMAFGAPVLAAGVFGIPELIRDGENGWLFEPRDMRALTDALDRVLRMAPEQRRAMGQAGEALVRERHRSTGYGDTYRMLLRELTLEARGDHEAEADEAKSLLAPGRTEALRLTERQTDETWALVKPYTMTSKARVTALCDAIRYVAANSIPGAVVECGVWKGGSMLAAARTLVECNDTRRSLWLYDTFSGMTKPDQVDRRVWDGAEAAELLANAARGDDVWAFAGLGEVQRAMSLSGYPAELIRFVVGPVELTLPGDAPDEIALLRLDTDWYESTLHELVHLFPRLSAGGILIIDDYDYWEGVRRAVDEYLVGAGVPVFLSRMDETGRIAIIPG